MAFSEIRKPFNLWSISVQYVAVPWGGGGHAPLWGKMCQYLINTWLNPPTIPYVLGGHRCGQPLIKIVGLEKMVRRREFYLTSFLLATREE